MSWIPFIIRDDDTCFFTKPEELELCYKDIYKDFPITLACIPYVANWYLTGQVPVEYWHVKQEFPISDNKELVSYLKKWIDNWYYSVALHWLNHTYRVKNHKIYPEFLSKNINYEKEIKKAKKYLEQIFWTEVDVFVPPSNTLSIKAYKALDKLNFNLLNLPWSKKWFNRPLLSLRHTFFFFKRLMFLIKNKFDYNWYIKFDNHWEMWSQVLTPNTDMQVLKKAFLYSVENNIPFCLATHYWEHKCFSNFTKKQRQIDMLKEFLDFVSRHKVSPMLAKDFLANE